jgi:hypothetical protein
MAIKNKYSDILYLPHHVSATHPQMPMSDRAAQFSPFAALSGFGSAVTEAGRLVDGRVELSVDVREALDMRLAILRDCESFVPECCFTYFVADEKKEGGAYLTCRGVVKKVDEVARLVILKDDTKLPIDDIVDISGDVFSKVEQ